MAISIYPPTLKSTQSAFLASTTSYPIYFTLQSTTSFNSIGHVQVRIVRQTNNKSIVNTSLYPDGIIYKAASAIGTSGSYYYYVSIANGELAETWQAGYLYKVQMRFGTNAIYSSVSNFATWKQEQIDTSAFSEWSTVMIIKAIDNPTVTILNAQAVRQDVISTERTESTLTPLFTGSYEISDNSNETVDTYKFDLYEGDSSSNELYLLETSGWLQHNAVVNTNDSYRFKTTLTNGETYTVVYSIVTVNGYEKSSADYVFTATETYLSAIEDMTLSVESDTTYCSENGCINLYLTTDIAFTGCYVITRTSEDSNYVVWEDLKYLFFFNQQFSDTLIFQDFTIESGVRYKYAIQMENRNGLRTSPLYAGLNLPHSVDFEYSYIYRNGVQLRLKFNQTMTSFKHTTLRTKVDTLGDQYAHITQNGDAYYAEFQVNGLISFQMDEDQTFFTLGSDGYYYNDELVIPIRKFEDNNYKRGEDTTGGATEARVNGENIYVINSDITHDNIFIERKFREKAEEFLNAFEYKLYRSPTEGNMLIGLINVSLTPETSLSRMIYNFTATAYEVAENTLENLDELGIIDIGEFMTYSSDDIDVSFGQISGLYAAGTDLYAAIREEEEVSIGGGYRTSINQLMEITVEQYPVIDLQVQILELEALRSSAANAGESTTSYDKQIAELEALVEALEGPASATIILSVNGTQVIVRPGGKYHLSETVNSLYILSSDIPIVVDYVCTISQVEDETVGVVSAIDVSKIWGQISGVFTGTSSVLNAYNYNYLTSETYRVYSNNNPISFLVYDAQGDILVDNANFDVYSTVNLYEIIKEVTQHQVELIYNTQFEEDENGDLTDGTIYYTFDDIMTFDIEADEGTVLYISSNKDGSDATTIRIGPTQRYTLNSAEGLIKYIALAEPQFCVINYKCQTNQTTME